MWGNAPQAFLKPWNNGREVPREQLTSPKDEVAHRAHRARTVLKSPCRATHCPAGCPLPRSALGITTTHTAEPTAPGGCPTSFSHPTLRAHLRPHFQPQMINNGKGSLYRGNSESCPVAAKDARTQMCNISTFRATGPSSLSDLQPVELPRGQNS